MFVATRLAPHALEVWPEMVPETEDFPAIAYQLDPKLDNKAHAVTAMERFDLVVRAIGKTNDDYALKDHAANIDAALDGSSGFAEDGWYVLAVTKVQPFRLPEYVNGVEYRSLGSVFRLLIHRGG